MSIGPSPARSSAAIRTSSATSSPTGPSRSSATGRRSRPTSAPSAGKERADAFGGVARALPALPASREIQERASALGWDWDAIEGVWEKVAEELDELRAASTDEEMLHELGDVLFALVNLARWMKLDPEEALRAATTAGSPATGGRALAAERGVDLAALSLAEKDVLWDEVKGS